MTLLFIGFLIVSALKDTGALAAGKRADLIVVQGNPLKDLEALRKVSMTIANGTVYDWNTVP